MAKPPTRDELFDLVAKLLDGMGFTIPEQAKIMGCTRPVLDHSDDLRAEVYRLDFQEVAERYQLVCGIAIRLVKLFGNDSDAMRRWIRVRQPEFGLHSVYELMAEGSRENMSLVFRILSRAQEE